MRLIKSNKAFFFFFFFKPIALGDYFAAATRWNSRDSNFKQPPHLCTHIRKDYALSQGSEDNIITAYTAATWQGNMLIQG